ncbi:hypothetical protein ALC53_12602 [Atta colombica]|uniref:Uncharacterized protein n=1 Tax=Atta colombica TaxID=520822 RepID=A0A151HZC6_9HYME|nr:hypothetical protein ALC53_12602 [Atta colombica]
MVKKFFVEGPNKGREFIRGAHPDDTKNIERFKRLRTSRPYLHIAAARIPKEVAADKTGLTSIETASSYSVRRLMFGRVSAPSACITGHQQRSSFSAGIVIITTTSAPSLPMALTRTFAVRRSTRAHHCYKCRSTNKIKIRIKRIKFERVGKIERCLSTEQEDTSWIGIREPEGGIPKRKMN